MSSARREWRRARRESEITAGTLLLHLEPSRRTAGAGRASARRKSGLLSMRDMSFQTDRHTSASSPTFMTFTVRPASPMAATKGSAVGSRIGKVP